MTRAEDDLEDKREWDWDWDWDGRLRKKGIWGVYLSFGMGEGNVSVLKVGRYVFDLRFFRHDMDGISTLHYIGNLDPDKLVSCPMYLFVVHFTNRSDPYLLT